MVTVVCFTVPHLARKREVNTISLKLLMILYKIESTSVEDTDLQQLSMQIQSNVDWVYSKSRYIWVRVSIPRFPQPTKKGSTGGWDKNVSEAPL